MNNLTVTLAGKVILQIVACVLFVYGTHIAKQSFERLSDEQKNRVRTIIGSSVAPAIFFMFSSTFVVFAITQIYFPQLEHDQWMWRALSAMPICFGIVGCVIWWRLKLLNYPADFLWAFAMALTLIVPALLVTVWSIMFKQVLGEW